MLKLIQTIKELSKVAGYKINIIHTTQNNIQIQCNFYQNSNGIFTGVEQSKKFVMETQKTLNSQTILRKKKKLEELCFQISIYIAKL